MAGVTPGELPHEERVKVDSLQTAIISMTVVNFLVILFGLLYPFVYEKELVTWLCRLFVRLELLQILTYYSLIFYLLTFNYFKIITPKRLRKMRQKRYQFMVKAIDNRQTQ